MTPSAESGTMVGGGIKFDAGRGSSRWFHREMEEMESWLLKMGMGWSSDGLLLPCAINASCAALVDAGIPLKHLAVAVCCGLVADGDVMLDPTILEEQGNSRGSGSSLEDPTSLVLAGVRFRLYLCYFPLIQYCIVLASSLFITMVRPASLVRSFDVVGNCATMDARLAAIECSLHAIERRLDDQSASLTSLSTYPQALLQCRDYCQTLPALIPAAATESHTSNTVSARSNVISARSNAVWREARTSSTVFGCCSKSLHLPATNTCNFVGDPSYAVVH
ncbi:hypothetical protein KSP39_PZI003862 [Platanthera zijinensis]|uniref:Uncharacterized protein n=1 Tax=Platanthera zijinensis TaxID=2320716 RepID=A0AAP0BWI4_9ASPA